MDRPRISPVGVRLYDAVRANPGIKFRALGRAVDIRSMGQLRHHVDRLCRSGMIVELTDGGFRRYCVPGHHDSSIDPLFSRLARPAVQRIARLLLAGALTRTTIRKALGCSDSTAGYHLSRMVDNGDLAKIRVDNRCFYAVVDADRMREGLAAFDTPVLHGPAAKADSAAIRALDMVVPVARDPVTVPKERVPLQPVAPAGSFLGTWTQSNRGGEATA